MEPAEPPGRRLARGVCRLMRALDRAPMTEWAPEPALRCDVVALGGDGEIWIVEVKSSRADFRADAKWQGYLDWCDRYFFAVPEDFPQEILPDAPGLILTDAFNAEILRPAPLGKLSPARRRAVTLRLARAGMMRLQAQRDPGLPAGATQG